MVAGASVVVVAVIVVAVVSATMMVCSAAGASEEVTTVSTTVASRVTSGTGGISSSTLGAPLADLLFFRKRFILGRGELGVLLEACSSSVSDLTSEYFLSFFPKEEKKLDRRLASFGEGTSGALSSASLTASPSLESSASSGLISGTSSFY